MSITGSKRDPKLAEYVQKGRAEAQEKLEAARDVTVDFVDSRAKDLGVALDRVSSALRAASEAIETAGGDLGQKGTDAAARVDRASKYLRKNEPGVFLHDLEEFSRRHMGWAMGLAFLAGFVVSGMRRR